MASFSAADIRGLIVDMDGVLWRGAEPIGDLPAIFAQIRRFGLKIVLATNNATNSPKQYIARLSGHGVQVTLAEVVNSGMAAARLLKQDFPEGGPVYVVGEAGLISVLAESGFTHTERSPVAVVAGMDRNFTYDKLKLASGFIRQGARFIATNTDPTFPTPAGLTPGAGSIIAAIQTASETQPQIAGKPSPALYETCMERMGTLPGQTLVIGDRLTTDIAGAQELGCPTALVLSGVTSHEQALRWSPPPGWIEPDFHAVITRLEKEAISGR